MALSPKTIDRLLVGRIACPSHSGLSIEVGSRGKIWRYRRRVSGSAAVVNVVLGPWPAFSIKEAGQWAEGLNEAVEAGRDPREAERAATAASVTVGVAHKLYIEDIARGDRKLLKPRTLLDKNKIWQRDIEPHLGACSKATRLSRTRRSTSNSITERKRVASSGPMAMPLRPPLAHSI